MLEGRFVLILGGASPIGQAVARLFAEHGAEVAAADEDNAGTRRVFAGLAGAVKVYTLKRFTTDGMKGVCTAVLKDFPRVDILVSATGFYKTGDTEGFSLADFRKMLDINLACVVRCLQGFLLGMMESRRGELIFIAPDLAGVPGAAAAAACAGAITSFARNVTMDYIRYRVRANTVLFPLDAILGNKPHAGLPEPIDAANAALWFACDLSRFVAGESVAINGGAGRYRCAAMNYGRLLEGKFAVVTSGAHGMGKYIAKVLIRHGAVCAINGLDPDGEKTAVEFRGESPGSFFVQCDMSLKEDCERFISEVLKRTDHVDILINNVGINRSDFTGEVNDERFEYTQQVNLHGAIRMARGFLPVMKKTGGVMLHISTIHSVVGMPPNTAYASSKSAINAFSGALAVEYAPFGIRSNVINPGGVFTGKSESMLSRLAGNREALTALGLRGDLGQPDYGPGSAYDIANASLFLVSDMSRCITGAVVNVDGGTVIQAHRFYERKLPADFEDMFYRVIKNRFIPIEEID